MSWKGLLLLVAIAWGLQSFLTYKQVRHFQQTVRAVRQAYSSGYLGIGTVRKSFRPGAIVILVSDQAGRIVEGRRLVGYSSLAQFADYPDLVGLTLGEASALLGDDRRKGGGAAGEAANAALSHIRTEKERVAAKDDREVTDGVLSQIATDSDG